MRLTENWELREFTKCIANANNTLLMNYHCFADPLIKWQNVHIWIRLFGCPPIICKDGRLEKIQGVDATMPWHDYFTLADKLLS